MKSGDYKIYPVDIESISLGDVDAWMESFSLPDTPDNLHRLRIQVQNNFYEIVEKYSGTFIGDVLLVKLKLGFEYFKLFSALRLIAFAGEKNRTIVCSPDSILFHGLLNNGVPTANSIPYTINSNFYSGNFPYKIKNLIYNIRINRNLFYYFKSFDKYGRISNTNSDMLSLIYSAQKNRCCCFFPESMFCFGGTEILHDEINQTIHTVTDEIVDVMVAFAEENKISLNERLILFLKDITLKHLTVTSRDMISVQKQFAEKYGPMHILGGTQAGYYNRLISMINKKAGGNVTGFVHGNDLGKVRDYRMETSIAHNYVTYTKQAAKDIKKSMELYKPINGNRPDVISLDTDIFYNLWKKQQNIPPPEKIKNVMLICFANDVNLNIDYGFPDPVFFDLEIKLIRTIISAGCNVLYKLHPDNISTRNKIDVKTLFGNKLTVVREPLEQVMDSADAFLFYYSNTTVFSWTLCSQKPVFLIDFDEFIRSFSPEAFKLLKKRCTMVPFHYNERNLIEYDENLLKDALKKTPGYPDYEFVENYLFP